MEDIRKVSSIQLYNLWKNLTIGLMTVIAMVMFSKLLPSYLSPVVSLIGAAFLYVYIYNSRVTKDTSCMIIPYSLMYCLLGYSFGAILLNVLYAWGVRQIPNELIFFNNPFIPALLLCPVACITLIVVLTRLRHLQVCLDCRLRNGESVDHGVWGSILHVETRLQLRNLILMFGMLTILTWGYYFIFYVNINMNSRDWYIFLWVTIIFFILDELYFIMRYYNLYLDMKENNEIITPEQINDMTAKTYLRYYVICGNHMYVDTHAIDPEATYKEVIDTPFFTKRIVNGVSADEVKKIIRKMTGYDGELRFFYGRKSDVIHNHSLLRYFYFLEGDVSSYDNMNVDGEWMDFEKIKYLYTNNQGRLADIYVADTTRLATIMLTEKTFDENGFRKSKIRLYNPSFNLVDVRNSNLDFQDDKWIEISLFNSDTPLFRMKRWWRRMSGSERKNNIYR